LGDWVSRMAMLLAKPCGPAQTHARPNTGRDHATPHCVASVPRSCSVSSLQHPPLISLPPVARCSSVSAVGGSVPGSRWSSWNNGKVPQHPKHRNGQDQSRTGRKEHILLVQVGACRRLRPDQPITQSPEHPITQAPEHPSTRALILLCQLHVHPAAGSRLHGQPQRHTAAERFASCAAALSRCRSPDSRASRGG
jgi:hypothetical protein